MVSLQLDPFTGNHPELKLTCIMFKWKKSRYSKAFAKKCKETSNNAATIIIWSDNAEPSYNLYRYFQMYQEISIHRYEHFCKNAQLHHTHDSFIAQHYSHIKNHASNRSNNKFGLIYNPNDSWNVVPVNSNGTWGGNIPRVHIGGRLKKELICVQNALYAIKCDRFPLPKDLVDIIYEYYIQVCFCYNPYHDDTKEIILDRDLNHWTSMSGDRKDHVIKKDETIKFRYVFLTQQLCENFALLNSITDPLNVKSIIFLVSLMDYNKKTTVSNEIQRVNKLQLTIDRINKIRHKESTLYHWIMFIDAKKYIESVKTDCLSNYFPNYIKFRQDISENYRLEEYHRFTQDICKARNVARRDRKLYTFLTQRVMVDYITYLIDKNCKTFSLRQSYDDIDRFDFHQIMNINYSVDEQINQLGSFIC